MRGGGSWVSGSGSGSGWATVVFGGMFSISMPQKESCHTKMWHATLATRFPELVGNQIVVVVLCLSLCVYFLIFMWLMWLLFQGVKGREKLEGRV